MSSQTMEINILEIDIHLVRIHVNLILKHRVQSVLNVYGKVPKLDFSTLKCQQICSLKFFEDTA